jgi:hypothetical protein
VATVKPRLHDNTALSSFSTQSRSIIDRKRHLDAMMTITGKIVGYRTTIVGVIYVQK